MTCAADSAALLRHFQALRACVACPKMLRPSVLGLPVASPIMLVGQAPGAKEPILGRPFAWTAGKTLFRWIESATGWDEAAARRCIYFAAVCRCFPGKNGAGGDRVPEPDEIARCARWLDEELGLLRPRLVLAVGRLAIAQFLPPAKLDTLIGRVFAAERAGRRFELLPLPHPSGASPWHRMEPGKSLLAQALERLRQHPALTEAAQSAELAEPA